MIGLYQTLADNFYPERADFNNVRNVGQEFADHLMDSFPLLIRRDLANSLSAMLRDGKWFNMGVTDDDVDYAGASWLQSSNDRLYKLMYQRQANFVNASKQGDNDFVTFGQCVKSVEFNRKKGGLLFRTWHLRDCAWFEDETGQVCGVMRKATPTRRDMVQYFGEKNVHPKVLKNLAIRPFETVNMTHMVMPSDYYGDDEIASKFPYVSVYIDNDHDHLIEETGLNNKFYVVPRFQTISGSAYAYSPATTVGLSDARCLQAMTHTLMEAAERYAAPPIIATANVVRGDIDLSANGVTYVDNDYDERLGASLRTLSQDRGGWPIGNAERERIVETLTSAFFLNKLNLPPAGAGDMTAYEVQERMKQFRRENLPLFAPIEAEDNGQVCELAFEICMANNMFGSPYDIPESLRDAEVQFKFESPLTASQNEQRVQQFSQVRDILGAAMELDPGVFHDVDLSTAVRGAVTGAGAPSNWLTDPEVAAEARQQQQQKDAMMQMAEAAGQ
jgi:hypothetical protein